VGRQRHRIKKKGWINMFNAKDSAKETVAPAFLSASEMDALKVVSSTPKT